MCGKPIEWENNPMRPFCSERCKLIDFGKWADEEYAVASDEKMRDEGESEEEKTINN
jgi:uncharacterized protein